HGAGQTDRREGKTHWTYSRCTAWSRIADRTRASQAQRRSPEGHGRSARGALPCGRRRKVAGPGLSTAGGRWSVRRGSADTGPHGEIECAKVSVSSAPSSCTAHDCDLGDRAFGRGWWLSRAWAASGSKWAGDVGADLESARRECDHRWQSYP